MMRHRSNVVTVLVVIAAFAVSVVAAGATSAQAQGPSINAGPQAGIVWQRAHQNARHVTSSPDLIWHGGPVRVQPVTVTPIFWGSSWAGYTGDKEGGLQTFYGGLGGSDYAKTNTEYTQGGTQTVSSGAALSPSLVDTSAAPSRAPATADVLAEVQRALTQAHQSPSSNGYYPVYIDQPRGHAGYCAWHSSGTIGGVTVQFAFFFNLDNDPGCDPNAPASVGHTQGLSALGNVSGHEWSEMMTDPQLNAWYDSKGAENSDKCAWTFGHDSLTLANGSQWKIQGNWSNRAYDGNSGYNDVGGAGFVRGCID